MRAGQEKDFFIWEHFLHDPIRTVIVLPSPHGDYKSGISYSDARAMGEIYAKLQKLKNLNVCTPELLGHDISKNLILIAGKKANSVIKDFQSSKGTNLTFDLEDGIIYDKEKQVVVTPQYLKGEKRTIENVTVDYGLIVYMNNPFGQSTKVLHLAGIKGCGTLAAVLAITEERYIHEIEKLIKQHIDNIDTSELENKTVEILVKAYADDGRVKRDSLVAEKIKVSNDRASGQWESGEYRQLKKVIPHRLYISAIHKADPRTSMIKVKIDDQEIQFAKSSDRLKMLYILAKQAREDYLSELENEGWVTAWELAERLWQIKQRGDIIEIPDEIRGEVSNAIITWARCLENQGKLRLDEKIKLDRDYINSEILVFSSDMKKKIADLVYLINQEKRDKFGSGFRLIESQPGLGYRINIHPALIFISV